MGAMITAILAKISGITTWFGLLFKAVFVAGWFILTDVMVWVFIGFLGVLQTILNGLPGVGSFELLNPASYVSGLPADLVNMIGLCRLGEAMAIILAACLIKLSLQIIPFTRLGS